MSEMVSKFELNRVQIFAWKKAVIDGISTLFGRNERPDLKEKDELIENLYKEVGKLKIKNDFLKNDLSHLDERRMAIKWGHPKLSLRKQSIRSIKKYFHKTDTKEHFECPC